MAQACRTCGGVGFGKIDARGFYGTQPCPDCNKGNKGNAPGLPKHVATEGGAVHYLDERGAGGEAYDPGVVNTGSEVVSIEDAQAQTEGQGG
jgi:hypothetical protein